MKDLYKEILENLDEGVYFVDRKRKITFWNEAAENITGYKANKVIGTYCYDNLLRHIDDFGNKLCLNGCPLHKTIEDMEKRTAKVYLHHKKGHRVKVYIKTIPLLDENKNVIGAIEIFNTSNGESNINSEEIRNLKELAYKDQLTKLFNRKYLEQYLDLKYKEFKKFNKKFSIIFLDIDHFKNINDTYGHDIGDEVLKMVSKSLDKSTRNSDLVVRWGGEEFVILCDDMSKNDLEKLANTIRVLVKNSYFLNEGIKINVTISIGATLIRKKDTKESVIKRADNLMYKSKNNGRNMVTID
ncbi:MAG: diguanylate cyclase [Bacillota bacterium]